MAMLERHNFEINYRTLKFKRNIKLRQDKILYSIIMLNIKELKYNVKYGILLDR